MKKINLICLIIAAILLGAGFSVNAGEIDCGQIDVTIEDDFYGQVRPEVNIDETNVILKVKENNEEGNITYVVEDNVTIPINLICEKESVYFRKKLCGYAYGFRTIGDAVIKQMYDIGLKQGSIIGSTIETSDHLNLSVNYEISEETYENGENITLFLAYIGNPIPGAVDPFVYNIVLDDMLGDGPIQKFIKEFSDIEFSSETNIIPILGIKQITLHIYYSSSGFVEIPGDYTLTLNVTDGEGSVSKNPNKPKYDDGETVNITANPADGYSFDYWSGDVTGSDKTISVVMDSDKEIQAHFKPQPMTVSSKMINFNSITLTVNNELESELTDIDWNITVTGGILKTVDIYSNGTIDSIESEGSTSISTGQLGLGIGKVTVEVKLDAAGEDLVESKHTGFMIGPLVLITG